MIIDKFERKISGQRAIRVGKRFYLFISIEDMNDSIKNIKPLKDSGVLIDGVAETTKHEIKKQEVGFLGALLAILAVSLVQPLISSAVKGISGRRVVRAGRRYMDKKMLFPTHHLTNIKITNYFNYKPEFSGERMERMP